MMKFILQLYIIVSFARLQYFDQIPMEKSTPPQSNGFLSALKKFGKMFTKNNKTLPLHPEIQEEEEIHPVDLPQPDVIEGDDALPIEEEVKQQEIEIHQPEIPEDMPRVYEWTDYSIEDGAPFRCEDDGSIRRQHDLMNDYQDEEEKVNLAQLRQHHLQMEEYEAQMEVYEENMISYQYLLEKFHEQLRNYEQKVGQYNQQMSEYDEGRNPQDQEGFPILLIPYPIPPILPLRPISPVDPNRGLGLRELPEIIIEESSDSFVSLHII
ncbi:hypothetical protein FGO68_gene2392 [Halteria grandinella]|uniref:Uncharacterized protein n=1 Tax=Halteria grandinella TaxID=5974 RepID=A0A8J8NCN7_HALGN|nr:hypothetical protein FGO68_gene2392 [Halteria grandinella]